LKPKLFFSEVPWIQREFLINSSKQRENESAVPGIVTGHSM